MPFTWTQNFSASTEMDTDDGQGGFRESHAVFTLGGGTFGAHITAGDGSAGSAYVATPTGTVAVPEPDPTYFPLGLAATASAGGSAPVEARCVLDIWDEWSGGSREEPIGTHLGRPNHLRQIHGTYVLRFAGPVAWTASASLTYRHNPPPDFNETIATDTESDSGTWEPWANPLDPTMGYRLIYDPRDPTTLDIPHGQASGAWHSQAGADANVPWGTATVTGTGIAADWGRYDEADAEGVYTSRGDGNTVTWYVPGLLANPGWNTGYIDNYTVDPAWGAGLDASARDWGNAAVTARGYAGLQEGDGQSVPTGAVPTPYESGMQVHRNQTGPLWWYARAPGRYDELITESTVFFGLDGLTRASQRDYWGDHDFLWIVPPDEDEPTWQPFSVSCGTDPIVVDDMTGSHPAGGINITGNYAWQSAGLGTGGGMTTSGSHRIVTVGADATDAAIHRIFLSDWDDCAADPTAYRAALPAGNAGKVFLSNTREWYGLMRRVRSQADVFNWGNRRWLRVRGRMAEGTGTFTLRITARAVDIQDDFHFGPYHTDDGADPDTDPSVRTITIEGGSGFVDVEGLTFSATDGAVDIDLAWVEHAMGCPLNHVEGIAFRGLEAGETYHFERVELVRGDAGQPGSVNGGGEFGFWTGGGTGDDAAIVPVVDGMVGARQRINGRAEWALNLIERWVSVDPASQAQSPRDEKESATRTFTQLALYVGMQEGLSATAAATPPNEWPDWALWLDAGWHVGDGPVQATVKMCDLLLPPGFHRTWRARGVFRGVSLGVAVSLTDRWAAGAQGVRIEGGRNGTWTVEDAPTTDDNGAWRSDPLPHAGARAVVDADDAPLPWYNAGYRVTLPDVRDENDVAVTLTDAVVNLGASIPRMAGYPVVGPPEGRDVSLSIAAMGFAARTYQADAKARVERRTLDTGGWTLMGERTGTAGDVYWGLDGKPRAVYVSGASVRVWDPETGTEETLMTGSKPRVALNRSGSHRVITAYRAGAFYALHTDGQGNTLYGGEVLVKSPAPDTALDVAFRLDGSLEATYATGNTIATLVSTDGGRTWT